MTEPNPEIPTQPQKPVQPEQAPVLPKKKLNLKIVAISLIVILLIAGGVYAGIKMGKMQITPNEMISNQKAPIQVVPTAVPEPTVIPTVDETANWKTYVNQKYHYQFKYPPERNFRVTLSNSSNSKLYVIRETVSSEYVNGWDFLVSVWENPQTMSLVEWLNFLKNSNALPLPSENKQIAINYSISGVDAFKAWNDPLSNGELPGKCVQACPILDVYFVNKGYGYRIELSYTKEVDTESQKVFNQILSTFKFIDQENKKLIQSPTPTILLRKISYRNIPGWPSYQSLMDFNFQYPPDYDIPQKDIVDFMNSGQFYCAFSSTKKVGTGLDVLTFIAIPKNYEDKIQRTLKIVSAPGYLAKEEVQIYSYPATILELDQSYNHFKKDKVLIIETDSMLLIVCYQQNEINNNWDYILESIKIGSDFNEKYFLQKVNECRS